MKLLIYLVPVLLLTQPCYALQLQGQVSKDGHYQSTQTIELDVLPVSNASFTTQSTFVDWNEWNRYYRFMIKSEVDRRLGYNTNPKDYPKVIIGVTRYQQIDKLHVSNYGDLQITKTVVDVVKTITPPPFPVNTKFQAIDFTLGNTYHIPSGEYAPVEKY